MNSYSDIKCLSQSETRAAILFSKWPQNINLVEDVEILITVKFRKFCSTASDEKWKMSQPIRGQSGHLVFLIGPKNTNLVEDVEILLPVKYRLIPFRGLREVERSRKCLSQWETRAAILIFRSARKTQTWKKAFH